MALFFIALAPVGSVSAAPGFTVNSTRDAADAAVGNGVCETASGNGVCTLRAAIQEAIVNSNLDIGVRFTIPTSDPGYNAQTGVWTINLSSALPDLSKSSRLEPTTLNITGPGADKLILDGSLGAPSDVRFFNVTTVGTVNVSGLTIANGGTSGNQYGAAVQNVNGGTVNITSCILSGNVSSVGSNLYNGGGGAIFNAGSGTINIVNSTLRSNRAATYGRVSYGGGIWNKTGTIHISNSTFDHNKSTYYGGAIWNDAGNVTVSGSTFYGNSATLGGAIGSIGGTVSLANSTFYANIAHDPIYSGLGGALCNLENSALAVTNSTLSANSADVGSGVFNENNATVNVKSSIIALNYGGTLDSPLGPDVYGVFTSQGFNFIGKKDGSTGFTLATDKKGTIAAPLNPKFDIKGLRNNGGPTQTIGLQTGSPAIDKGTSAGLTGALTADQRGAGFPRTVDKSVANASGGDGTDVGAFELSP